jgi:multiple sugar transport system substrate-binding protein
MPKFPDPTKVYTAKPMDAAIDATTLPKDDGRAQMGTPDMQTSTQPVQPEYTPPPIYTAPPPTAVPPVAANGGRPTKSNMSGYVSPSPFRNLIPLLLGVGAFLILGFLALKVIPSFFGSKTSGEVNLTYWGLWEPSSVMQSVIADYERDNPNIKITYTMQSPKNYRSRLQSAISGGTGPDIARIHNTWLPMLRKSLSPKPDSVSIDPSQYYPTVRRDFVVGGKLYAAPLEIDGLSLYYNEDILKEAKATPPTDWNALRKLAFDLTKRNVTTGIIERAGIAIGTTTNVDHWSDILGLLILQNSGDPGKPDSTQVRDALTFYTIFSTSDKSWDTAQPSSTYAFATGTVAMMIAPSWAVADIKAINPDLHYKIVPAPTLPNTTTAWASYWAEAVPATSKNPAEAWKFLAYLSSPEVLQKLYTAESQIRPIGEPYPLTSQSSLLSSDPLAGAFVSQGPNFTSWYMAGKTGDEGINDELIKYYEDAVNAINNGSTVEAVTKDLSAGVTQILAKYPEALHAGSK